MPKRKSRDRRETTEDTGFGSGAGGDLKVGRLADRFAQYALFVSGFAGGVTLIGFLIFAGPLRDWPLYAMLSAMVPLVVLLMGIGVAAAYSVGRELDRVTARQIEMLQKVTPDHTIGFIDPKMEAYAPEFATAGRQLVARFVLEIDRLRSIAFTDEMTKLPNRFSFEKKLRELLVEAQFETPVGVAVLDIDGFSRIKDMVGPLRANELVREIANRLSSEQAAAASGRIGEYGKSYLARLGPDEFAVIFWGGFNRERVATVVETFRRIARTPFEHHDRLIKLSVSGGIAMAPDDGETADDLLHNAELALADARASGAGSLRFFTPRLNRLARGRIRFETELRDAVQRGEFVPVFQPKVDFATGEIVGAEALARWRRANGKAISPAAFIPIAEQMGLIDQIGESILRQACEAAASWAGGEKAPAVAVNVSPRQFEREDFVNHVIDTMCSTGLQPRRLELEITETLAVGNPVRVKQIMKPLRAMGVKLAIDDFGSGHANLSILTQLPFDVFKIDRQFVSALEVDRQAPAIVEMILAMAETLRLKTVAEGVETQAQAEFLRRRGCHIAQGYLFAPPLSAEDFARLVASGRPLTVREPQRQRA